MYTLWQRNTKIQTTPASQSAPGHYPAPVLTTFNSHNLSP